MVAMCGMIQKTAFIPMASLTSKKVGASIKQLANEIYAFPQMPSQSFTAACFGTIYIRAKHYFFNFKKGIHLTKD